MPRWVLHVDMDAFFASVEQALDPTLRGRPVIVAGSAEERGVVSAASYEARRYGVRAAMPTAQARRLCPEGVFVRGNHAAYDDYSRRILTILQGYTPLVEQTSIDEAYLDVTGSEGLHGDAVTVARKIKEEIRRATGLTASVGVAPNRLLAKIASGMNKPDGLTVLRLEDVPATLWPRPVDLLPGIGPSTAAHLRAMGLGTLGELAAYPVDLLVHAFGVGGRYLHEAANGRDDTPVPPADAATDAKSLSRETTFATDVDDLAELQRTLLDLSEQVARRLRRHGYRGRTVNLKIRKADFTTVTRSRSLPGATDLAEDLYREARQALAAFWRPGLKVRLLGVGASNLEKPGESPGPLFDGSEKLRKVSRAVDRIKDRYGEAAVTRARLLEGEPKAAPPGETRRGGKEEPRP